ncbi:MAG: transglutaminase domain-containing protein, partial [Hyphomicrobiaceae bacterium]
RYGQPVSHSHQCLHLSPRPIEGQTILSHALLIEPAPSIRHDSIDTFGNPLVRLEIDRQHEVFSVHASTVVEVTGGSYPPPEQSPPWEFVSDWVERAAPPIDLDTIAFACHSRLTPPSRVVADYVAQSLTPGRPILSAVLDLTRRIYRDFRFDATATDVSTPVDEVMRLRRGVCQDFSHLALAGLRAAKIPARYVSGYLLTRPPPGQPKLRGADASHAWIAINVPGTGWVDFDPTNGIMPVDEHIAFAIGRDYDDVNPISGIILGGAEHNVTVAVDVDQVT